MKKTWTKAEQTAAYIRAGQLVGSPEHRRLRKDQRDDVVQDAFVLWLAESDGEPIDAWLARAVSAAVRQTKKRHAEDDYETMAAEQLSFSAAPEEWIDAKREFRAALPKEETTGVQIAGEFCQITDADLEAEQLATDLESLTTRYQLAARRNPKDERLRALGFVLLAAGHKDFDLSNISGITTAWATSTNRGPRTRAQEADALISAVQSRDPDKVVRVLSISPLVTMETALPAWPWSQTDRSRAADSVATVLASTIDQPPVTVAKAVLVALGCSPTRAKELDAHLRKRNARAGAA